ncbi:MAG: DJ-1/PfpI family protein [bacterium]
MSNKVAIIIARQNFRDEEYFEPKAVFEQAGLQITTVSTQVGTATGKYGKTTTVDLPLEQLDVSEYDVIAFIGGPGSYELRDNKTAHKIAQETVKQDKLLAAICAAPGILAKAGVLKGKKATMFEPDQDILIQHGATFTGNGVEVDGKIITATGPETAKSWAKEILKALEASI